MKAKTTSSLWQSTRRFVALAAIIALAAGCGDGGSDDESGGGSSAGGGGGSSGGGSISISGNPPAQVMQDAPFSFTPTVVNPDGVSLTFTASGLPGWASINSSTGEITGTPRAGDVGSYSGIRVTVSGAGQSVTSRSYSIEVVASATGSATLTWTPPTENTDGTPLTDLSGYRIYYGQSAANLNQSVTIDNPGLTSYVIDGLTAATWYFAATAYDSDGFESTFSSTVSKTIL